MYDLIGGHVNNVQGGLPELMGRWKGAANVLLQPFPELVWLHGATKGRTVVRAFPDDSQNPDFNDPNMNPMQAARTMVDRVRHRLGNYPCSHVQITNEPAISSSDAMKRMGDFDAECSHQMKLRGRKITLANLAQGNPPDMSWWRDYQGAIAQGMADGAVLLVHAYTWPGVDDRWHLWRHRMIYNGCPEHGWEGLPRNLWIDLVIGEIGFDYGVVESGIHRGWRNLPHGHQMEAHDYAVWLEGVNRELLKDKYVVGAAVFCCSNLDWKWTGYDVWPEPAAEIATFCTPLYRHHETKPDIVNLVGVLPVKGKYPQRWVKNVDTTVIHHSGGRAKIKDSVAYIKAINRWCQWARGWNGFPYHFAVGQDGTKYRCLKDSWKGNHTGGWNRRADGIVSLGNHTKRPPTAPQQRAVQELIRWRGHPCKGHRDIHMTACPGFDFC